MPDITGVELQGEGAEGRVRVQPLDCKPGALLSGSGIRDRAESRGSTACQRWGVSEATNTMCKRQGGPQTKQTKKVSLKGEETKECR